VNRKPFLQATESVTLNQQSLQCFLRLEKVGKGSDMHIFFKKKEHPRKQKGPLPKSSIHIIIFCHNHVYFLKS